MSRTPKQSPVEKRRGQIEKEIANVQTQVREKTLRDFKSADDFQAFQDRRANKLYALNEELAILDRPEEYNEIPLAIAAEELGVTLADVMDFARDGLLEISSEEPFSTASRITRDELGRAIDIGTEELLRIAAQTEEEVFFDGLQFLRGRDVISAERCLERIWKFKGYDRPYWNCYGIGVELISGRFDELKSSLGYLGARDIEDLAAAIPLLKAVAEAVTAVDNVSAVFLERILAFTDGFKATPFDQTFQTHTGTDYYSRMDENQRHAMFISNVVFEAIGKYKFKKELEKIRGWGSGPRQEELERVIRNAVYTALEAEATYHESPSSKLFVDKFVELFPKRWIPAEHIELLPKASHRQKNRNTNGIPNVPGTDN